MTAFTRLLPAGALLLTVGVVGVPAGFAQQAPACDRYSTGCANQPPVIQPVAPATTPPAVAPTTAAPAPTTDTGGDRPAEQPQTPAPTQVPVPVDTPVPTVTEPTTVPEEPTAPSEGPDAPGEIITDTDTTIVPATDGGITATTSGDAAVVTDTSASLPFTGGEISLMLFASLAAIGAGVVLNLSGRPRKN